MDDIFTLAMGAQAVGTGGMALILKMVYTTLDDLKERITRLEDCYIKK